MNLIRHLSSSKRPSFATRLTAYCNAKDGLLQTLWLSTTYKTSTKTTPINPLPQKPDNPKTA